MAKKDDDQKEDRSKSSWWNTKINAAMLQKAISGNNIQEKTLGDIFIFLKTQKNSTFTSLPVSGSTLRVTECGF